MKKTYIQPEMAIVVPHIPMLQVTVMRGGSAPRAFGNSLAPRRGGAVAEEPEQVEEDYHSIWDNMQ